MKFTFDVKREIDFNNNKFFRKEQDESVIAW